MPTLFLTGRTKIRPGEVTLRGRCRDGVSSFDAELDLGRLRDAEGARVWVEAYHATAYQRFDFGTPDDPRPREPTSLTRFEASDRPLFRVKVVRPGGAMLLAGVEGLHADWGDAGGAGRSWLHIVPRSDAELGGELWRVDEPDAVTRRLLVNRDAGSVYEDLLALEARTAGLILPAAYRTVLERDLLQSRAEPDPESPWLMQAVDLIGDRWPEEDPGGDAEGETYRSEVRAWIDLAVSRLARDGRFSETLAGNTENQP